MSQVIDERKGIASLGIRAERRIGTCKIKLGQCFRDVSVYTVNFKLTVEKRIS